MKKVLYLILVILLGTLLVGCNQKEEYLSGKVNVLIKVKDYGDITLELDADEAPITVTNFVNLVKEKFYNNLTFHRIVKDFVIQGGDPNHDGTGSAEKTIKGEFASNGIQNNISHKRGVISMARGNDFNGASCQFFIVHKDSTFLDGNYAAFGHVTKGMDVVDKIANVKAEENDIVLFENQPVIESISLID